ncbi:HET domain-containing protein, partial [Colletotrichum higginsianum]
MWMDTCFIEKSPSAELSEVTTSMCRWYGQANVCYVYLSDMDVFDSDQTPKKKQMLRMTGWFLSVWTPREVVAPRKSRFFHR